MSLTKDEKEIITKTHDKVTELTAILLGSRGDNGLIGEVRRNTGGLNKLRRNFWLLVGVLAGSGVIGAGIAQIMG